MQQRAGNSAWSVHLNGDSYALLLSLLLLISFIAVIAVVAVDVAVVAWMLHDLPDTSLHMQHARDVHTQRTVLVIR